jgi:CCR4-NOT transcriptional regulation complex NOT5 subunit
MNINERIRKVIDVLADGSRKDFADKIGISSAQVYNIIATNGRIGEKNLSKILLAYPAISQQWLRTEEGSMLTDGTTPESVEGIVKSRSRNKAKATKSVKPAKKADATKTITKRKRRTAAEIAAAKLANEDTTKTVAKRKRRTAAEIAAAKLANEADTTKTVAKRKRRTAAEIAAAKLANEADTTKTVAKRKRRTTAKKAADAVVVKEEKATSPKRITDKTESVEIPVIKSKKLDIAADSESKPINNLILGQRDLIATNIKLVEANLQLVDTILKLVKK